MNPSFTIDERGITIILTLESQYEKAVAKMLKDFEVVDVTIQEKDENFYGYNRDREVQAVIFRLNRREVPVEPQDETT